MTNITELKQKAKMPAKQAGGGTVAQFFEANKGAMAAVLPKHVNPERMTKIALTAIRNTPKLMEATTESLMGAVMQCAQFGLEPNTVQGHAYLIPFRNNKANRTDVQVIIGYKGLIDLARRSGQIVSIAAHAVCEQDEFEFVYGLEEKLEHKPALGHRGEIIAFYAVAHLKDGGYAYEVMSRTQIDEIRDNAQGYKQALKYAKKDGSGNITYMNSPWFSHYEQMGRKTVIRRLAKFLPMSIEMATAVAVDAMAAEGKEQNMADVLTGEFSVVDEDAPNLPQEDEPAADLQYPILNDEDGTWTDKAGELFDEAQHVWDKTNEQPTVNKDGCFRKRPQQKSQEDAPPVLDDGDPGYGGLE